MLKDISCHNFIVSDGYAYFSNYSYNGIFKTELQTGRTFFLGIFPEERLYVTSLHWGVLLRKDMFYFIPRWGKHLHIYNPSENSVTAIKIKKETEERLIKADIIIDDNNIIFIPKYGAYPVRQINIETLEVKETKEGAKLQGIYPQDCQAEFQLPQFVKKNHMKWDNRFLWKELCEGQWMAFMPSGNQLIYYNEKTDEFYRKPISVINKEEYNKYLIKVKTELLERQYFRENYCFRSSDFLKLLSELNSRKIETDEIDHNIGIKIWNLAQSSLL